MSNYPSEFAQSLTFFNQKITAVNGQRLHLNRNKGLAKFIAQGHPLVRNIAPIDKGMGYLSFSLYFARMTFNLGLLAELLTDSAKPDTEKTLQQIYYELANDLLWFSVNLSQFYWLSFANSQAAGMLGLQFETIGNAIDLIVLIVRFVESNHDYEHKMAQADAKERARMEIEWEHKKWNFIRGLLTLILVVSVFAQYSFAILTIPIAPTLSVVVLISALIRLWLDFQKDSALLMQEAEMSITKRLLAEQRQTLARWDDLNQMVLNHVYAPLGLFLLITSPAPIILCAYLGMILLYGASSYLISSNQSLLAEEESRLLSLK
ncbi:MAG: hypothetical protein EPN84_03870 [Legionella sp.]|nr:MAG: hypothetical protein EPN84_03870 [Legionella sp.]